MFRILGSVDTLNKKMGVNLTHYDINWIYNRHHLIGQKYYLKTRYPEVRLILCLPESNKGMNKDYLIVSGEWHDGLYCSTREEGTPSGAPESRFFVLMIIPLFPTSVSHDPFFLYFLLVIWLPFDLRCLF